METDLAERVRRQLDASHYSEIRRIQCRTNGHIVVLTGTVSSYHLKQLAQEAIRNGCCIQNELEVVPPRVDYHWWQQDRP